MPFQYASALEPVPLGECSTHASDEARCLHFGTPNGGCFRATGGRQLTSALGCCILVEPRIDNPPFPGPRSPCSMPAGCPGHRPPHPRRAHLPHPSTTSLHSTLSFARATGLTPTSLHMFLQFTVPAIGPVGKAMRDPMSSHPSQDWINVPRLWFPPCYAQICPPHTHTTHRCPSGHSLYMTGFGGATSLRESQFPHLWKEGSESDLTGRSDTQS